MQEDDINRVVLTVNGVDYSGWLSVSISAGVERQARDFTLAITRTWPGAQVAPRLVQPGDVCEVSIGPDKLLTGYVYALPVRYDDQSMSFGVAGRSLTSDLVDCAADNRPGQWRGQTVRQIVTALAAPYGIKVVSEVGDGGVIADHQIQPGDTVFQSIDSLLRKSLLLSTDDEQGRLVLVRPGSGGRCADALELGKNILTADAPLDFSQTFSEYVCKGQRSGSNHDFGKATNELSARVSDPRVPRKRVMMVQESGQMTVEMCRQRVEWERSSRMGKALAVSYTVAGWRQSNGVLWRHNAAVRVIDSAIGFDRDMLITEVEYRLDENGMKTRLSVAPPEAVDPEPADPLKARKKKGKTKNGDEFEYLVAADGGKLP